MALFSAFIIAMLVTMLLIPPLMRSAEKWRFLDIPDGVRKIHQSRIPRIGGIAMIAGALLPIVLWSPMNAQILSFLAGVLVIFLFGLWDDRKNLNYRMKFLGQIVAVVIVVVFGDVTIRILPFGDLEAVPAYISWPLTIIFLTGVTNAINLSDGLDGLAGGTTLLILGVISLLGYLENNLTLILLTMAVMGSVLGFLRFNTYPARIFMGDGGSQFLGFSVGVFSILLTQSPLAVLSPALPLLLIGLPILDTSMVILQRIYEGRSPFRPDKNHVHHKLLALGLDHYEAVFVIYAVQAALVLASYYLRYDSDLLIVALYAGVAGITALFFYAYKPKPAQSETPRRVSRQAKFWQSIEPEKLLNIFSSLVLLALPALFLSAVVFSTQVSLDLAALALVLLGLTVISLLMKKKMDFNWVDRAGLYIMCAVVVYLMQSMPVVFTKFAIVQNLLFALLAVVVIFGFRYSKDRKFEMTTLDFLIIFITLTVPNLPGSYFSKVHIGTAVAQLIVLFYSVEFIVNTLSRHQRIVFLCQFAALGLLAGRGIVGV